MCGRFVTSVIRTRILSTTPWQNNAVWHIEICSSTWKGDQDLYRNRLNEETC